MTVTPLRVQHSSLQFSDSPKEQEHDLAKIFGEGQEFPIKTGTEAGGDNANLGLVKKYAEKYKHSLQIGYGNWVAVDRRIIKPGSVKKGQVWVANNDLVVGHMHHRVMMTLAFTHQDPRVGRIAQGAAHYPTKGRPGQPNHDINNLYSKRIEQWMRTAGRGNALAFVNGDFNMLDTDPKQDWAFGRDFTSMADELKDHENTGHGPIDGFCSYNRDKRVSARRFNALSDKTFNLFSDHYLCRGVWDIRHLKI